MDSEIVVWNVDARYKPELEVEIAIECPRRDDVEVAQTSSSAAEAGKPVAAVIAAA